MLQIIAADEAGSQQRALTHPSDDMSTLPLEPLARAISRASHLRARFTPPPSPLPPLPSLPLPPRPSPLLLVSKRALGGEELPPGPSPHPHVSPCLLRSDPSAPCHLAQRYGVGTLKPNTSPPHAAIRSMRALSPPTRRGRGWSTTGAS